jgi:hypothetical protein
VTLRSAPACFASAKPVIVDTTSSAFIELPRSSSSFMVRRPSVRTVENPTEEELLTLLALIT